jgi:ElaB/YqjD/DUF883 family membrane-anchored ribosome-binding protein
MSAQDQGNGFKTAANQAQGALADTAERVKGIAADAGGKAQELALEAGRQVAGAAQAAYASSGDVLETVESLIRENPWSALLIAGAAGYGLACLVKHR